MQLLCALFWVAAPAFAADSAYQQLLNAVPEQVSQQSSPAPSFEEELVAGGRKAQGIGLSHSGNPFDIPDFPLQQIASLLRENRGTHYRPHLPLNEAVPELSAESIEKLRQAGSNPAILDAMIDDLSKNGRWDRMDGLVDTFTGAGIKLILVVGAGYRKEAPFYAMPDGAKGRVSPDRLGRDLYITMAKWIAGAGVRRYGEKVGAWQVENEINIAGMVSHIGWRVAEDSWGDKEFLKRLLAALSETVHAEGRRLGRDLKTTHNFATDSTAWKGWAASGEETEKVDFKKDIDDYGALGLDIIGIDLYANYFFGWPLRDGTVGKTVSEAVAAAGGRPVWVLETGFPRAPGLRGFSEARQGEYFRKTFDAAYGAGADLVLAFGWFWNPQGWYTDNPKPKPWWNPQAGEQYWSPISVTHRSDGSIKDVHFGAAWDEFKSASQRWVGD
ncbi:MAG: hypothetical protein HY922_05195 [Elusimicrobia bacterium]|nr:hypothetical protein [Elusimicrobiota bacterium]